MFSLIHDLVLCLRRSLALLECDFPASLNVIVFQILHHLPMFLQRFGPVYGFWMYGFERFNSWISRRSLNRRFPEATIVETYHLYEFTQYVCLSTNLAPAAFTLSSPQPDSLRSGELACNLISDHLHYLDEFYQDIIPDYKTLVARYG